MKVVDVPSREKLEDDYCIDQFARLMKEKMDRARAKGRRGWQSCSQKRLSDMLRQHVEKGDVVDIANFCMMLGYFNWSVQPVARSKTAARALAVDAARQAKLSRLDHANEVLYQIGSLGRRFFFNEAHNRFAEFSIDNRGMVWLRDDYTGKLVYVSYKGQWRNFSHGGTCRAIVEALTLYITQGVQVQRAHLGPWPHRDLWGYGKEAMDRLRNNLSSNLAFEPHLTKEERQGIFGISEEAGVTFKNDEVRKAFQDSDTTAYQEKTDV